MSGSETLIFFWKKKVRNYFNLRSGPDPESGWEPDPLFPDPDLRGGGEAIQGSKINIFGIVLL